MTVVATLTCGTLLTVQTVAASTPTFLQTLAGRSEAAMYPSGLVWDANDNRLVVADTGYNRISVFQGPSWQTPVEQFGSYGTGNGQFNTPREVAVDSSSNIYVADAGNNRVQAFDSQGNFLWATTPGPLCKGCMNNPIGVTYDFANNVVLVADTGHSVIKALNPANGVVIWTSPGGLLASPRDAIRGPDGRIWIADYNHQEVKAFAVSSDGLTWNTTPAIVLGDGKPAGHLVGELNSPYNVQFDPGYSSSGGTVYVADTGNERISIWTINGTNKSAQNPIGSRCPAPCPLPPNNAQYFNALRRVAVDPSGHIWGADFWGSGIHEFSPSGNTLTEIAGAPAPAPGFAEAYGIAVGSDGMTYAVDRLNQRIEAFDANGNYLRSTGVRGVAPGTFSWPETVAVAPDNTVWVGDTRNNRLQQFSAGLTGAKPGKPLKPLAVVGAAGSGIGQFNFIEGITVDGGGIVWVADTNNNRIQSYNPGTGHFNTFGSVGSGQGQFNHPQGIAVSGPDVYVADTLNNRVEELLKDGTFVASFSTGLNQPQGVTVAPDGSVWVADSLNNRIVHLSGDLSTDLGDDFGGMGTGNMQFFQPHSLDVFGSVLFVADTYNSRVQEFSI
jgi:DNA-binding beta-propeller fold protein YncE